MSEWLKSKSDISRCMNLACALNNMFDYDWKTNTEELKVKYSVNSLIELKNKLSALYFNIGMIRDIADSHKHFTIERSNAMVKSADNMKNIFIGFGQGFGLRFGGGKILIVHLANGDTHYFDVIVDSVYNFWSQRVSEIHQKNHLSKCF